MGLTRGWLVIVESMMVEGFKQAAKVGRGSRFFFLAEVLRSRFSKCGDGLHFNGVAALTVGGCR